MVDNETLGVHKSGHPIIAISIYIQLCNCIAAFNYLKAFLWVGKNISGLASSLIVKKGNIILIKVKKKKRTMEKRQIQWLIFLLSFCLFARKLCSRVTVLPFEA